MTAMQLAFFRRRQRSFERPTSLEALPNICVAPESKADGPISDAESDALMREQSCSRRVACLFGACCPADVADLIVRVIIDSFQCISWRTRTHIGFEDSVIKPALTHANAAPAITIEIVVSRIATAIQHSFPNQILARLLALTGFAMCHTVLILGAGRFMDSHAISSLQEMVLVRGQWAVNTLAGLAHCTAVTAWTL